MRKASEATHRIHSGWKPVHGKHRSELSEGCAKEDLRAEPWIPSCKVHDTAAFFAKGLSCEKPGLERTHETGFATFTSQEEVCNKEAAAVQARSCQTLGMISLIHAAVLASHEYCGAAARLPTFTMPF